MDQDFITLEVEEEGCGRLQFELPLDITDEEVAYMGDDIVDIAVLSRVGLAAAPADAVQEVRDRVHWVASSGGGAGAARELLELILRAQGRWDAIVRSFTASTSGAERT